MILGGDDGCQFEVRWDQHTGFQRDTLLYDPRTDRWEEGERLPFAQVTTPVVLWKDRIIVPSGEIRPGIRSAEVWAGRAR
jgi:N-acetylneuraminic acid mutarotase